MSGRGAFLVTYDVCDPKRLRRVYRVMRGFGEHLQLSVFRCELSEVQRIEMLIRLERVIKQDEDQVLVVPLGRPGGRYDGAVEVVGRPMKARAQGAFVF